LPRGKRFPDIEYSKKYKAQQQIFPVGQDHHARAERVATPQDGVAVRRNACGLCVPGPEATEEEGELLAGNFIDDNSLRVLGAPIFLLLDAPSRPRSMPLPLSADMNEDKRVKSERPQGNVSHPYSSKRHAPRTMNQKEHRQGNTCQRPNVPGALGDSRARMRRDRERDAGLPDRIGASARRYSSSCSECSRWAWLIRLDLFRFRFVHHRNGHFCIFMASSRGRARGSRLLQKGTPEVVSESVGCLQMGHRSFMRSAYDVFVAPAFRRHPLQAKIRTPRRATRCTGPVTAAMLERLPAERPKSPRPAPPGRTYASP